MPVESLPLIQQASLIYRQLGDPIGGIDTKTALRDIAVKKGEIVTDRSFFNEVLELARKLKSKAQLYDGLIGLGIINYQEQNYSEMEVCFRQVRDLASELYGVSGTIYPIRTHAFALLHLGDIPQAGELFRKGIQLSQDMADPYGVLSDLVGLAGVALQSGDPGRAARLLAFFEHQMEGYFKPPDESDRWEWEWRVAALRSQLTRLDLEQYWEQGRAMTLEAAVAEALTAG